MRVLITAGPTRERIDAVRFISNRSSGRMGVSIAEAAREAGHEVVLLLGPSCVTLVEGVTVERFESVADLAGLLDKHFEACDILIMAAAVADYRVAKVAGGKLKRAGRLTLELEATEDLVAQCAASKRAGQKIIAFALEEAAALEGRAREKMHRKGMDAIVANPLETMEGGKIEAAVLTKDGRSLLSGEGTVEKEAFARWLVGRLGDI